MRTCFAPNSTMSVVRNTQDPYEKLDLFNDYLDRIIRQHACCMMNNDIRSTHASFAAKYIEQVCTTLRNNVRDSNHL